MQNETFCFIDDIRQKKTTATGAHHKVIKTGCKLPHEYLKRKELKQLMNTPIISTNPMSLSDFRKLSHEDQQRQLDMWGDRYGRSSYILSILLDTSQGTAHRLLSENGLNFMGTKNGSVKDKLEAKRQTKLVCDTFYGRAGTPTPEPVEEPMPEPIAEETPKDDLSAVAVWEESKEQPTEELANPSRFNFSIAGVFTSDEMEILLRSLRSASQIDPDGKYELTLTMTEAR